MLRAARLGAWRRWVAFYLHERREKRLAAATPTGPLAPANLDALDTGFLVQLTWQDLSSDEQGFRIYRQNNGGGFVVLQTLGANFTSAQDAGVVVGHIYDYYVTAYNASGESAASNVVTLVYGA